MSAEEGHLSNPEPRQLSHHVDGVSNSRGVRQPPSRRHSEEKPSAPTHQLSYLSMLTNQRQWSGGNGEDGITAATAEAMKNFSFEKPARNSEMNEIQQRGSTAHASLHPESPRNGPTPFLATRHSRQFIPQKSLNVYDSMQEKDSHAVTKPDKLRHRALVHSTHHEARRDTCAQGIRPAPHCGAGQPSGSLQEVAFHATPHSLSSSTPDVRLFLLPTGLSNQALHRTGIPGEHSEDFYDEKGALVNGDHEVQGQEGDRGNDSANEEPAGYFRSSELGEELEQAPGLEQYLVQSHDHAQPIDPILSQDSSVAPSPISEFSAGFAAQFEDYVRTHQQEAQDAEERWRNATIEEWKVGKIEMIEHVRKIVDLTKNHMKRKLTAYRALHDDLDGHKDTLHKRRKLLGKLENDAQQTGKGLMNRFTSK